MSQEHLEFGAGVLLPEAMQAIENNTTELYNIKLDASQKGAASGVAELDESGKVPSNQLPAYVDDILEFADFASLPAVGEAGKIYVTLDDNHIYRWSGSAYFQVSSPLVLGTSQSNAHRGDHGSAAYIHSQETGTNPHGVTPGGIGALAPSDLSTILALANLVSNNPWVDNSRTANEDLTKGDPIQLYNGGWRKAQASAEATISGLVRICGASVTAGNPVVAVDDLILDGLTSITPGATYYVGVAGGYTTTPPTGDNWILPIGKGHSTSSIKIKVSNLAAQPGDGDVTGTVTSGATVLSGRLVQKQTDGSWKHASNASASTTKGWLAIALTGGSDGGTITLLQPGSTFSGSYTSPEYFLAADGTFTDVISGFSDGDQLRIIGYGDPAGLIFEPSGTYATIGGHGDSHTDGTDDIQSATNSQKGLATAEHITAIEANTAGLTQKISSSEKGVADGVAELDSTGKVTSAQLPSYVDDILEFADAASLPAVGEAGKIYVTLDDNHIYRWSGSAYIQVSSPLVIGTSQSNAHRGDHGTTAYNHSQATGNPHGATTANVPDSADKRYITDTLLSRLTAAVTPGSSSQSSAFAVPFNTNHNYELTLTGSAAVTFTDPGYNTGLFLNIIIGTGGVISSLPAVDWIDDTGPTFPTATGDQLQIWLQRTASGTYTGSFKIITA